jgi:tetratricopeptide (TPR) repeat protein
MEMDMEPGGSSAAGGCIARVFSWGVKLFLLGVVVAFLVMGYVVYFSGTGNVPDWMMKGYTNQNFRAGEKHMKQEEYELAIHEFEQALTSGADNAAMVESSRLNIAYCYEKVADNLEALTWAETPEAQEAIQKQNEAYERALEQYSILLKENPKNKTAQVARDLLLMKRG